MPIEPALYINQLNEANPLSTDSVSQADDHLRLIKAVLKTTFPNITGPVTATQSQLNNAIPSGVIVMWSGAIGTIPSGWALCDGSNGTPDLRSRFIVGAGSTYAVGAVGGSTSTSTAGSHSHTMGSAGSHNHTGSTGSTALTIEQIPAHTHSLSEYGSYSSSIGTGLNGNTQRYGAASGTTGSTGSGQGHAHTITSDGSHAHSLNAAGDHSHTVTPPYYALAYIMKT